MKKTVNFNVGNVQKETPLFWRKVGTSLLVVAAGAPMVVNQFTFNADWKANIIGVIGAVALLAKGLTMFFAEKEDDDSSK